ncbi:MAG: dTDP-glucose 4,6-dehydratase [Gammaproteobacteria bacterium]|nr:dTDP-glucose 4,6-dehydratase [Gammaproteobacteria bacterium]MCP5425775.1 dTDP-glucose 4,6-dehydratase [Gammaproteobacteria bacterium]MCP5458614.1 dTDP-glucose 4,6-dehydratase [Gammaproteobacteria bacterium]
MDHQPSRVLITGGAGFIGCNFVRYLLKTDRAVQLVNLDKLTYAGSLDNLRDLPDPTRHRFVQGDICNGALVERLLRKYDIDTVVHFAAESHVDRSINGPSAFIQANMVGTFTLLEAARTVWLDKQRPPIRSVRFHHISTDEVYGTLARHDPPFAETTPYAPNSPYSASKAGSDHLVRAYGHTYGLPWVATNCSNNYGPYQHPEKFIPTVIRSAIGRQAIPVYGDGSNIRDWLYVEDHCRGIDTVLRHGHVGETYNIGGDNEWANLDIARAICRLLDERRPEDRPHERLIHFVDDRPGHDWRYAIDTAKIKKILHWQPQETFASGIARTIDWYLRVAPPIPLNNNPKPPQV